MTELETLQRAKDYMDKLAQGIDPITNEEVPNDSALNNLRLARCFFYISGVLQQVIDNGGKVVRMPSDFSLTPQQLASIDIPNRSLRISEFVDLLHSAAGDTSMKKPSTTVITNWLLNKGLMLKEIGPDGKSRRIPTEAGHSIGIFTETRQTEYGEYLAVLYTPQAQRFLLDNWSSIVTEK